MIPPSFIILLQLPDRSSIIFLGGFLFNIFVKDSSLKLYGTPRLTRGFRRQKVVVAKIATTTQHGAIEGKTQTKDTNYYSLDAIISVGYRMNSKRATHFRIWATSILKE